VYHGGMTTTITAERAHVRVRSATSTASYRVRVDGPLATCECKGFRYRGSCRHVTAVRAALAAGDDLEATR